MKTYHKLILVAFGALTCTRAFSQTADEKKAILRRGIALNDSGKYDDALAKYQQLIKIDSNYMDAYYETAYTLFSSGKEEQAIPYLNKVLKLEPNSAQCYDMLASIYDDLKQPDKAIDLYKKGISIDSTYQRLHFNLAITCYRVGKYDESEESAIKAIKIDATHASSHRILAMAAFAQRQNGISLLAWSNFLLLEPQSKRSVEAYGNLLKILNYGLTARTNKGVTMNVSPNDGPQNMIMQLAVTNATGGKKDLSPIDTIQADLTNLYQLGSEMTGEKTPASLKHFYADYYEALAKSGNMPAFVHYITLSAYKDEDLAWFKDHDAELKALQKWITETQRSF